MKLKKTKIKKHYEQLKSAIEKLLESKKFKDFVVFQAKFRKYSLYNTILIWSQKPDATYVAGIKTWNSLGRKVRKGEKGILIFAPVLVREQQKTCEKATNSNESIEPADETFSETEEEKSTYSLVGFKPVYVFDISQTEGKPIPEMEQMNRFRIYTDIEHLYRRVLTSSPVPVEEKPLSGGLKGFYSPSEKKIVLSAELNPEERVLTLLHELAHHYTLEHGGEVLEKVSSEVVAEGAACVTAAYFGLDTMEPSAAYMSLWAREADLVLKCGETIRGVANRLIDEIEKVEEALKMAA
jgi:antirestriction protein ArdC